MKSPRLAAFCWAIAGLAFAGCAGKDNPTPIPDGTQITFLQHENRGCTGTTREEYGCPGGAYLRSIESIGDTLFLTIHFEANCCPEFIETTSSDDGILHIDVQDTLSACRCICDYENRFSFLYDGGGEMRIEFVSRGGDPSYCVSAFDTLVTLPEHSSSRARCSG
jgi:hypothetical protein